MATRKTKNGYWVVSYRDENGKGRTRSFGKGRAGKTSAEKFDAQINYNKKSGKDLPLTKRQGVYFDTLVQSWINEKKAEGKNKRWLNEVAELINNNFLDELTTKPAHLITQNDILDIIVKKYGDNSQTTRNRYIGYLKSIFERAVEAGEIDKNPLFRWKKVKEAKRNSQLTLNDLKRIQEYAKAHRPHLSWGIEVLWNIPVRPGKDLFGLSFASNVDFDRGGVWANHNKVGKTVFISCRKSFMEVLAERKTTQASGFIIEYNGKPISSLKKTLNHVVKELNLPYPVCLYDVRHLWITEAVNKGMEISVIAECAGTSVRMIMQNYYENHSMEKERLANAMPGL